TKLTRGGNFYVRRELSSRDNDWWPGTDRDSLSEDFGGRLAKVEGISSGQVNTLVRKYWLIKQKPLFELLMAFRPMFITRWFGERTISMTSRCGASGRFIKIQLQWGLPKTAIATSFAPGGWISSFPSRVSKIARGCITFIISE